MEKALMCPQCNAPLTPHKFARSIVCAHCGATIQLDESSVSASKFHDAFQEWNASAMHLTDSTISLGNRHWALDQFIAHGDFSDAYAGRLARFPTELVLIKILRDIKDKEPFNNEWHTLQRLQKSNAPGADTFTQLIPQPVIHGELPTGQQVSIFRRASGFQHTFKDVIQAYPNGIAPQASIWVWRRILEVLSFIHASGMAHGAVLPEHLLVQENEHGVRLVGYSAAGPLNENLRSISSEYEFYYPKPAHSALALTAQLDLVMSARCMAAILGGDPQTADLPQTVPTALAGIIQRIAHSDPARTASEDAWAIREELGQIARDVFGPPMFNPIVMPKNS